MSKHTSIHVGTLSPEMALLGLLYGGPGHGYDLHRQVVTDLGQVWHLSQSQAYAILKRLEVQGDILGEEIRQAKLPPRLLFHLTPQGKQRFLAWLEASSGGSARAIRMEFVTRLYFIQQHMPEKVEQAFSIQRNEVAFHIHRLENLRADLPAGQVYNRMSLDMRLKQLHCVLEWLADCQQALQISSTKD
jgi:PadR family transcriptional regulator AphA